MARIRTIKPSFFRHKKLYELEVATGLPMRIAFAGLFATADREGRFKWRPEELKLDALPYDQVDFAQIMDELAAAGFLKKFIVNDEEFGCIPTWKLHQTINAREAQSTLPAIETGKVVTVKSPNRAKSRSTEMHMHAHETHVQARGEGKGREEEKEVEGKGAPVDACAAAVALAPAPVDVLQHVGKKNACFELVEHWKAEYLRTYGTEGVAVGSTWGTAKNLLKYVPLERAKRLVTAYLDMRDQWFITKRHSLTVLIDNIDAVNTFLETGATVTRIQINHLERAETTRSQLDRVAKGLL